MSAQENSQGLWKQAKLRGSTVYVAVGAEGEPTLGPDKRVTVVYKLSDSAKRYRANPDNLEPLAGDIQKGPAHSSDPGAESDAPTGRLAGRKGGGITELSEAKARQDKTAIHLYTDGACSGNPGPAGLGVVRLDGEARHEHSEYLGIGTNNIAELTAILRALELVEAGDRNRCVYVYSDSAYAIGLLTKNWKAKANQALVATLRAEFKAFPNVSLVKVKGHSGVPENERADALARDALAHKSLRTSSC